MSLKGDTSGQGGGGGQSYADILLRSVIKIKCLVLFLSFWKLNYSFAYFCNEYNLILPCFVIFLFIRLCCAALEFRDSNLEYFEDSNFEYFEINFSD